MELTSTVPQTAWATDGFRAYRCSGRLLFGRVYEDSEIELGVFEPCGRVFCIAGAGCTAFALAADHEVVAVDLNPVQIAYVRRRLGGSPFQPGSAEQLIAFGRALARLAGWSPRLIRAFLALDDPREQISYWRRYLDTRRFRAGFDFLLSRFSLRAIYSPTLLDCLPRNFGSVLRNRMERCFSRHSNCDNPYARSLFLGEDQFGQQIVDSGAIEVVCADAAAFLESQPAGSFTGFALSNILDGANAAYRARLLASIKRAAAPGARVVLRSFSEPEFSAQTNQAAEDRSMLWGIVDVRPAEML
jgi:S-adenosylmethionine:diacylglycerol 3-amino-3-carboxypropyl transferase